MRILSVATCRVAASISVAVLASAAPASAAPAPQSRTRAAQTDERAGVLTVTPEQAAAVERGLAWLAANQTPDGSWIAKIGFKLNSDYRYTSDDDGHLGVTSLAGMAFLAGGHLPGRGVYGPNVERALDFVLGCVQDDGYITKSGTRMYDHAFATLFLAEICGMTYREDVKQKLQKAVDFIVKSQNAQGGWRYEPYASESDMSIVVCQVIALRAARNIGIRVPKTTVDNAARYVVDSAVTKEGLDGIGSHPAFAFMNELGTFHYQKDVHSRSSFPLTAAGVTALHGLGIYSDDLIRKGLEYLGSNLGNFNSEYAERGHYYFWYGHYYAVQAMYTAGSPYWEPYFEELRRVLLKHQNQDGSWPNQIGPGPAFGTAMGVLILEIPYRFLPIFQR
jgi:squalene cyclase